MDAQMLSNIGLALVGFFGGWTHISVPNSASLKPRRQALVIDKTGTRAFA
jgi:hypothetical protein